MSECKRKRFYNVIGSTLNYSLHIFLPIKKTTRAKFNKSSLSESHRIEIDDAAVPAKRLTQNEGSICAQKRETNAVSTQIKDKKI